MGNKKPAIFIFETSYTFEIIVLIISLLLFGVLIANAVLYGKIEQNGGCGTDISTVTSITMLSINAILSFISFFLFILSIYSLISKLRYTKK